MKDSEIARHASNAEKRPSEVAAPCACSTDAPDFRSELTSLINKHHRENGSNTPDFILRDYMCNCLCVFDEAVMAREMWHGREPLPEHTRYGVELPNARLDRQEVNDD